MRLCFSVFSILFATTGVVLFMLHVVDPKKMPEWAPSLFALGALATFLVGLRFPKEQDKEVEKPTSANKKA